MDGGNRETDGWTDGWANYIYAGYPFRSKAGFQDGGGEGLLYILKTEIVSDELLLSPLGYREPSVVTAYVYQGIHRRLLGQHRFEFLSRTDSLYRLLYGEQDPINFMCEALKISPAGIHDLDAVLAETFKSKAPDGFDFIGTHTERTGKYNCILWAQAIIGDGDGKRGIHPLP